MTLVIIKLIYFLSKPQFSLNHIFVLHMLIYTKIVNIWLINELIYLSFFSTFISSFLRQMKRLHVVIDAWLGKNKCTGLCLLGLTEQSTTPEDWNNINDNINNINNNRLRILNARSLRSSYWLFGILQVGSVCFVLLFDLWWLLAVFSSFRHITMVSSSWSFSFIPLFSCPKVPFYKDTIHTTLGAHPPLVWPYLN